MFELGQIEITEEVLTGLRESDSQEEIYVMLPMSKGEILTSIDKTGLENNHIHILIHNNCCGHNHQEEPEDE